MLSHKHFQNVLSLVARQGLILNCLQISNKPTSKKKVQSLLQRAKNLMNTKLILCATSVSSKNSHSWKLSKLASSASPSHCSNCNTHLTTIINTCSLTFYCLLKSATIQKAAFLPMTLAQNFYFSATFPTQYSLEPPSVFRRLGWWSLTPP